MSFRNGIRLVTAFLILTFSGLLGGCAGDDPLDTYRKDGAPLVTEVSPGAGLVGTTFTIRGENFGTEQGNGSVKAFCGEGGAAVDMEILSWTDRELQCRLPSAQITDARVLVEITNSEGKLCPYAVYITVYSGELDQGD